MFCEQSVEESLSSGRGAERSEAECTCQQKLDTKIKN